MKHPHDAVIRAYLDGKTVQFRIGDDWMDCGALETYNWRMPDFIGTHDWRIKPDTVKLKYRLYLARLRGEYCVLSSATEEDYGLTANLSYFVKWLGPEQEIEVEG